MKKLTNLQEGFLKEAKNLVLKAIEEELAETGFLSGRYEYEVKIKILPNIILGCNEAFFDVFRKDSICNKRYLLFQTREFYFDYSRN